MAVPALPDFGEMDDGEKRSEFILWLEKTLHAVVTAAEYEGLFVPELYQPMQAAWQEARPGFAGLAEAVHDMDDEAVLAHGLGGCAAYIQTGCNTLFCGHGIHSG